MVRIQKRGSSYVQADFRLTPREYALIRRAQHVTVDPARPARLHREGDPGPRADPRAAGADPAARPCASARQPGHVRDRHSGAGLRPAPRQRPGARGEVPVRRPAHPRRWLMRNRTTAIIVVAVVLGLALAGGVAARLLSRSPSTEPATARTARSMAPFYTPSHRWTDAGSTAPHGWTPTAVRLLSHAQGSPGTTRVARGRRAADEPLVLGHVLRRHPAAGLRHAAGLAGPRRRLRRRTASGHCHRPDHRRALRAAAQHGPAHRRLPRHPGRARVRHRDLLVLRLAGRPADPGRGMALRVVHRAARPEGHPPRRARPAGSGPWLRTTVGGTTYGVVVAGPDGSHRRVRPTSGSVRLPGTMPARLRGARRRHRRHPGPRRRADQRHRIRYAVDHDQARTAITYRTPAGAPQ